MSIAEKLTAIAENQQKVYDAGGQAAYDAFWDSYQDNGNRTNCRAMFAGYGWTKDTLKPKYDMSPTEATELFCFNRVISDMRKLGIKIDFSKCTSFTNTFNNSTLTYATEIIATSCSNYYQMFNNNLNLVTVERFEVNANATYSNTFAYCSNLSDITFAGTIGQSLDMSACPLNKASIESIIGCLSTTATGKTLTLKSGQVDKAFETSEGAADGRAVFEALIADKTNWKFSY